MPKDQGRTPIRELIKEAQQSRKVLDKAIDVLDAEFASRLNSLLYKIPYGSKGTILDMANRLLPPLTYFDDEELEQIGRYYLWKILEKYAQGEHNVWISVHRDSPDYIFGLNDTQQEQIIEWFGPPSKWIGGRTPVVINISMALSYWNVRRRPYSPGIPILPRAS
jgi:hypothetical protein